MTHGLQAQWSEAAGPDRDRLAHLGDQALLGLVRDGDGAAFAELYARHRVAARRLARRLAHGRVEADDVVAETFTRVLRVLRRGGGPTYGFRVYLLTAVRRTAWYLQDKDKPEPSIDALGFDCPDDGPDLATAAAERGLMAGAFASLPERWRTVLWHTDVEGEPARQVARILGISPNGVAALTYRARSALTAAYLQAHLAESPSPACRPFAAKLGGYTADRGGQRDRDRIAAHLAGCAECSARAAELRDVRSSLRAVAGPLLLGPAAFGYLSHSKLALGMSVLVQHGKVTAAATASGAAASGEAVAQLVSHHGKLGAALAGAALTAAGALGLVATDQSVPEASSPQVMLTAADPGNRAAGQPSASPDRTGSAPAPGSGPGQRPTGPGAGGGTRGSAGGSSGPATDGGADGPGGSTGGAGGAAGSEPAAGAGSGSTSSGSTGGEPGPTTTLTSQPAPTVTQVGGTQPAGAGPAGPVTAGPGGGTEPTSSTTSAPWPTTTSSSTPTSTATPTASPTGSTAGPQKQP
jgi:RNA polymerase sigma factor (sigma-70 family)